MEFEQGIVILRLIKIGLAITLDLGEVMMLAADKID